MSEKIEQKVLRFVNLHNLLPDGARVLLAVSGGADSVAILKIIFNLRLSGKVTNDFHIAHINHQLRGKKSFEDEEFVKTLAKQHNIPVTIERVDVKKYAKTNKLSIETAARFLRLGKLAVIAKKNNCSCIASAHHKNDNAETVIHRLLRGTAFKGLAGIRPKTILNGTTFIRPLLCVSRNEIEDYLSLQNINWQTDHTNLDCRFTRNRIRHRLLPTLQKQAVDDIIESLFILSRHCLAFSQAIEKQTEKIWRECLLSQSEHYVCLDTEKFNAFSFILQVELIQKAFQCCGIGLQKITNEHYRKIMKFLKTGRTGRILQLPGKAVIKKQQKDFYIGYPQLPAEKLQSVRLKIPGRVYFSDWVIETEILPPGKIDIDTIRNNKNNFIQWFDLRQIKTPLTARLRRTGDKFRPFGLASSKRIGKFLTSAKIGSDQKKKTFLVCDGEKILWLAPIRRNNEAVITSKSKKLLQIKVKNSQK